MTPDLDDSLSMPDAARIAVEFEFHLRSPEEKVLVIACDKRSADECVRMLRAYANEDVARPLLNVNRHDYLEFANKGSIRVVTVSAGGATLVGTRIDSIIEVL